MKLVNVIQLIEQRRSVTQRQLENARMALEGIELERAVQRCTAIITEHDKLLARLRLEAKPE